MPALGNLKDHPLVAQCAAYCAAKGLEPKWPPGSFLMQAVYEYGGDFAALNDRQRAIIAGCAT